MSFNKTLNGLLASKTYGKFCLQVYGRDLSQFNAFDDCQLQFLISTMRLMQPKNVLDLGCGVGRITEYLSAQIPAKFTGIDFADQLVAAANDRNLNNERLSFRTVDINSLPEDLGKFDLIISIDTLYFADDLEDIISKLKTRLTPNGYLVVFFDFRNKKPDAVEPLMPEEASIGKALNKSGFSFETADFTENDKIIWKNALMVANELKTEFLLEGFENIYEHRVWEAERNLQRHNAGLFRRAMFIAHI